MLKQMLKYLILFLIGGMIYYIIEIIYRGYSHISMFILGGICFIACGLINELLEWETPLWKQSLIGATLITVLEFVTGLIVNIGLGLNVWDYSNLSFNILGQISLSFFFVWCFISIIAIVLDDYLRYYIFKEEKPKYVLFDK